MSADYVLITPARNEEEHIEKTILSVISQDLLPKKWVIVSDASTDATDRIIQDYSSGHDWIEFVRMPHEHKQSFGSKVDCFNAGYQIVLDQQFSFIGNIDGDISFDSSFFSFLIAKLQENTNLGIVGAPFIEDGYDSDKDSFTEPEHVAGACQLFRRKCFEHIGGYRRIEGGGIDWVAVKMARMHGWETRTFYEKHFFHHHVMGTKDSNILAMKFRYGKKDYSFGNHPLWEFLRAGYQMTRKPYLIGGGLLLLGYLMECVFRAQRPIPDDIVRFHRAEQMRRLSALLGWSRATSTPQT